MNATIDTIKQELFFDWLQCAQVDPSWLCAAIEIDRVPNAVATNIAENSRMCFLVALNLCGENAITGRLVYLAAVTKNSDRTKRTGPVSIPIAAENIALR